MVVVRAPPRPQFSGDQLDPRLQRIVQRLGVLAFREFPIILSPCDWRRYVWLSRRQFLPGGDRTVEEHYTEPGPRKRLFLEIREGLRERVEWVREPLGSMPITTQFQDIQKQLREKGELSRQPLGSPSIFTKSNPAIKDEKWCWQGR